MRSLFFTNHMQVLAVIAERPDVRLREVATEAGITERAAHRIVSELVQAGYIDRQRRGSRNRYVVRRRPQLDRPTEELLESAGIADHPSADLPGLTRGTIEQLGAAFDAAPTALAIVDRNGTIIAANDSFGAILGRTQPELTGESLFQHAHPDDIAGEAQRLASLLEARGNEYAHEARYLRADGTITWVRVTVARSVVPLGGVVLVAHLAEIGDSKRQGWELADAEERFRSSFDNAPIGIALVAPDGRFLKVNRAISEITGYSETALLTRTFQSITHPDDLDADLKFVRQMLAGEIRTYQMDKRYVHADGHIVWVSLSVSLVRDPAGEPQYFIAQTKDVTQRRAAEQSMRLVVDRIAEAVSIIDSDGRHLHINSASRAVLDDLRVRDDLPIVELYRDLVAEDGTPLDSRQLPAEITRVTGEEINEAIVGFPSTAEEIRWLRISTRRLSDGSPPHQVIVSYTDVTARKHAERALALSEARLEGLFRYIPAALSLRGLDGRYLHVTDSVARALGCRPDEAVGRHPSDHLTGEILAEVLADDEAMKQGTGPISREVTITHADKSEHDYYTIKWPIYDDNGAVGALGAFSIDITDSR